MLHKIRGAVVAGVLLMATCACGHGGDQASGATRPRSALDQPPPSVSAAATAKQPITLQFAGDTHFEDMLATQLAGSPSHAMGPIAKRLKDADFTMVNLETAITTGGVPAPGKQFHFRAPATALAALKAAGVSVVTMANNHGMDYSRAGLNDSLAAIRKSGFPVVGIGANAGEAYRAYRTTVKGNRLAVLGATQVIDDQLVQDWTATDSQSGVASAKVVPRMLRAVRDARQDADIVIVYLHWGQEMHACPLPRQQELAEQLIDAGADIVVGSHAHVLLGGGYLKGKYVDYGLGNFHFSSAHDTTAESGILRLTWDGTSVTGSSWIPARISNGLPLPLSGKSAATAVKSWAALRACSGLTAKP